ncbi:hypothetical protein BPTFM16_01340 [Altererythrobacter insulae]|nr:hypothetical protein BPTFM16_01340 [Altererythrobacter insulae]
MDPKAVSAHYTHMKHIYLHLVAGVAATFGLGASTACAQQTQESDEPVVIEEAADPDWNDQPQTSGSWFYEREGNETFALFGQSPDAPVAIIRCDLATSEVGIGRFGTITEGDNMLLRIRTETQSQSFKATPKGNVAGLMGVEFESRNPLLDAMAITQGRFALEVEGNDALYLPAWAEVTRVIEDCRQ